MRKIKRLLPIGLIVVVFTMVLGVGTAKAMIDSTVIFDIAWSGLSPIDTTYWGTPYQVNTGDMSTYDGMFEYLVRNWSTSSASIRKFEVWFPSSLYLQQASIIGTPTGWDLGIDSGSSGSILVWGETVSNPILPGQSLNGFLVNFRDKLTTPKSLEKFVQAYDVYENYDRSGQRGKGLTMPVPEPSSMLILGFSLLGMVGVVRKKISGRRCMLKGLKKLTS